MTTFCDRSNRRISCSERKTSHILLHPFFKGFNTESVETPEYVLPGYSDNRHQDASSAYTSQSYKNYTPESLHFTGDPIIWAVFEEL